MLRTALGPAHQCRQRRQGGATAIQKRKLACRALFHPAPPRISASVELTLKQAIEQVGFLDLPPGIRVYLPDIDSSAADIQVRAACELSTRGYVPVPHLAARRIPDRKALEGRIHRLATQAGVRDVLLIAGDRTLPAGEFSSSIEVLATGCLEKHGISEIGIAGHPEGSPDFADAIAMNALLQKKELVERKGLRVRIVTQFGFDELGFIAWAERLSAQGLQLPIHVGVAGPASIPTLLKYAAICGVGNSLSFLKKRSRSLFSMASGYEPEEFVEPIEAHLRRSPASPIVQIHVFPFGGVEKTADWLTSRGSWAVRRREPAQAAQR